MKQQHTTYQVVPYSKTRRLEAIAYCFVQHRPMMSGLFEVDVTRARASLKEYQATTGESLSFTAFLIACLGKAVAEHEAVQAYRKGCKHLILFWEEFKAPHWPWLLLLPAFHVLLWLGKGLPTRGRSTGRRWASRALGCLGKGPDGVFHSLPIPSG